MHQMATYSISLLGHLNYACILSLKAESSFHTFPHIMLDEACKMGLKQWHQFLSFWNLISFFYDDQVTKPEKHPDVHRCSPFRRLWQLTTAAVGSQNFSSLTPSSTTCEMYPVVIVAIFWGYEWSKKIIAIDYDNSAVVDVINKGRSHCLDTMQFMRRNCICGHKVVPINLHQRVSLLRS